MDTAESISGFDAYLFNEGKHYRAYQRLGAHVLKGGRGVRFAVWAPNARSVSVIGDFNGWNRHNNYLQPVDSSGIWEGEVPAAGPGQAYKFHIRSHRNGYEVEKADPMAFCTETPPRTASVVHDLSRYEWQDAAWMEARAEFQALDRPMSIYEVHLGSWRRKVEDYDRPLSYLELAETLVPYVKEMGYTHVEFLPVMEHPFGGSWGYQVTGYFAPSRRYGDPEQLMALIDRFHQAGIGVILDWVPSHFPNDRHGLDFFDGTHLYEHADPRQGYHPDWHSDIFNYGRNEVRSFLISNACFWLDKYHADGLRVDGVASMLYLDYSRQPGEWIPNAHGGRENLEAIRFLRDMNQAAYGSFPGIQMMGEESTSFPLVSRPVHHGGLGFGYKWDMGWMHDTLKYFHKNPVHRKHHQQDITFRSIYAFHENFILPLSHDEVVHGKGSLLRKMPGDDWQKFANLRCLYAWMYATPGKKLLFMGGEFAQRNEWNHNASLDWHLLSEDRHRQVQQLTADLNRHYRVNEAFHIDCDPFGFEWIDGSDAAHSVVSFLRKGWNGDTVLCVFNFTPVPRHGYWIGVPSAGTWEEILNTDSGLYGGSNLLNGAVQSSPGAVHGRHDHLSLTLPPLGAIFLKRAPS